VIPNLSRQRYINLGKLSSPSLPIISVMLEARKGPSVSSRAIVGEGVRNCPKSFINEPIVSPSDE